MFGRATITLGIGPHSSYNILFQLSSFSACWQTNTQCRKVLKSLLATLGSNETDRPAEAWHIVTLQHLASAVYAACPSVHH